MKTKLLWGQNSSFFYCASYHTKRWALLLWNQFSKKHCWINPIWIALDLRADFPILKSVSQLKFSHISCKDTSENESSLSSSCNSCRTQQCLKWIFEILGSYILISNYDLQSQIIFCLSLGYLAMKHEADRQKPSSQEPGWCFRAEGSRN